MEEDRLLQWLYLASLTTFPQFSDLNTAQVTVTSQNSSFIHMVQSASLYSNASWRGSQYKRKRKYQLQCPPRGICHSLAHRPPGSISRSCSSASPLAAQPLGAHMTDTTNKQTNNTCLYGIRCHTEGLSPSPLSRHVFLLKTRSTLDNTISPLSRNGQAAG